jgi:hypothetical protein
VKKVLLVALACVLLTVNAAYAQSDRGTITGTIADESGAMIPNAPVEAENLETGAVFQAASSETGNYTLVQLPAGKYQLSVSVSGFKQYVRTGLTVMVAQTLRIDVQLELGSIAETVIVSADAPLLKTESSELSHVITSDLMDDLPMLSIGGGMRDSYSSVNLIPGAQQMSVPGGIFGTLRVNGMPGGSLALRIEGQDATQQTWSAAYGMSQPSVDSIQETAIQTSNYAAEFGQAGGGLFNMTMRSGSNSLHGSAFEYLRNETMFNATQPYNHQRPRDRRHDFGFTVGGPVYLPKLYDGRDKTFFFFSFEQNRLNTGIDSWTTIPTEAYRAGDFSSSALYTGTVLGTDAIGRPIMDGAIYDPSTTRQVVGTYGEWAGKTVTIRDPFMGCDGQHPNVICTTGPNALALDSVAQKIQSYLPSTTNDQTINNYHNVYQNKTVNSIYSIKMDHNLSPTLKLSGYWSLNDQYVPFPDGFPPPVTTERDLYETAHTARINIDYTISPTMLLHLGGGIMHFVFWDPTPGFGEWDSEEELGLPGTSKGVYPTIMNIYQDQGGGMPSATNQGNGFGPIAQQKQWEQKPTGTATLSWVRGNHSLKFGAELRVESFPSTATTPSNGWFYFSPAQTALPYLNTTSYGGGNIGFPYASFLLGEVNNGETGLESHFHIGKHSFAFFAQDTWKVTPKLTIDFGLRYDYQTYLKSDGRLASFGYDVPNPAYGGLPGAAIYEGNGRPDFASNYPWAFGPRLGVAYQITPKTVFRGGIGVSYSQTAYLEMWTLRFGSDVRYGPATTFGESITQLEDGAGFTPVWPDYRPESVPASPGANFMTSIDRHAGYPPRQLMWSVGIQREITSNMSFEVAYVGNRGVWWNSPGVLTDPNRVTPDILAEHNMSIGNVDDGLLLISDFNSVSPEVKAAKNLTAPYPGFQGTVSQALRPYPHFGSIFVLWAPLGNTWYDSLQAKFTKRLSYGLDLMANYTFQKELTVGTEAQDTAFMVNPAIINLNDLRANKGISASSIPHRLVIAGTYLTPDWTSMHKPLRHLLKDWRIGAYLVYQSGFPIMAPMALNYPNPAQMLSLCAPFSVLGGCNTSPFFNAPASYSNRKPGVPLFTQDINSNYDPATTFILNADAWETPPEAQFGVGSGYYNDYRYRRRATENMSLERVFRFREGMSLSIRAELNNVFNRTQIPSPSNSMLLPKGYDPTTGLPSSGFGYTSGYINAGGQRTGQLVLRFRF